MVMFHCYVSSPEGRLKIAQIRPAMGSLRQIQFHHPKDASSECHLKTLKWPTCTSYIFKYQMLHYIYSDREIRRADFFWDSRRRAAQSLACRTRTRSGP